MADKLDEFKKSFEEIKKSADKINEELDKHQRLMGQTTGIVAEGCKEIGLRVADLKENGKQGTAIDDFLDDKQVKEMYGSVNDYLKVIQNDLTKITKLKSGDISKLIKSYYELKKDIKDEVAKRDKEISTKLGTGNKSLPDMKKLMKTVNDYQNEKPFAVIEVFEPEVFSDHEKQAATRITREIAKSKGEVLDQFQKTMMEQALNTRILLGKINQCKTLHDEVISACQEAEQALAKRDQKALMTAKGSLPKPMKELNDMAELYKKAVNDQFIKGQIKISKDKAKIEKGVEAILGLRDNARVELTKIANAQIK